MSKRRDNVELLERTTSIHELHYQLIIQKLQEQNKNNDALFSGYAENPAIASVVLFLLGQDDSLSEPCLILNKRSDKVPQSGDLCCPGGGVSPKLDLILSKFLRFSGTPLTQWPFFSWWHKKRYSDINQLALLLSTGLREGFEEMRLNPMGVRFLGQMKPQELGMLNRVIYPMVCWVSKQKKFYPNWEVDKIVTIPLENLLNSSNYALYKLQIIFPDKHNNNPDKQKQIIDLPCFLHKDKNNTEMLWGATFRITMDFLHIMFNFKPPENKSLKVVHGTLDKNYITK